MKVKVSVKDMPNEKSIKDKQGYNLLYSERIEFLDNLAYAALCDYLSCKLNYADYLQKIESINLYLKLNEKS